MRLVNLHTVTAESESMMWFRNHDRGSYDETLKFNELSAESGSVNIAAGRDINIEIAAAEEVDAKSNVYFPLEGKSDGGRSPAPEGGQNLASTSNLNLNGNVTYKEVTEAHDNWNEETEGLTEVGAAIVAVAAAVATGGAMAGVAGSIGAAAGTGVVSVGVSGAIVAGTSAAASQISVSTVNNQGDLGQVMDDLDQSQFYEGILISAAVAGVAAGTINALGGAPDLETGSYADSKVGVNVERGADGNWYFEGYTPESAKILGIDVRSANIFNTYVVGNQNPVFKGINAAVPSVASGAMGHDTWVNLMNFNAFSTMATAAPYIVLNMCAATPNLCGIATIKNNENFD